MRSPGVFRHVSKLSLACGALLCLIAARGFQLSISEHVSVTSTRDWMRDIVGRSTTLHVACCP